jgi:hypothetical protein
MVPAGQPGGAGEAVREALDQPQRGGGGAEGSGEQVGEQGGGDLVADVGQEAGRPDAANSRAYLGLAFAPAWAA